MSTRGHPWYRQSHRCWYVWYAGSQVRLHHDEKESLSLWHKLEAGVWVPQSCGPTLSEVVADYLLWVRSRQRMGSYLMKRARLQPLVDALPQLAAVAFDSKRAEEFLEGRKGWGGMMRWTFCCQVKTCLRWAVLHKKIDSSPLEGWSIPRSRSKRPGALVSDETHEALSRLAPAWLRDVLIALRETGCRPSEVYGVTAADCKGGCWVIKEHKTSGTTGSPRVIHMTATMDLMSRRLCLLHASGGCLFRNGRGETVRKHQVAEVLRQLCRDNSLPHVYPYAYRHTFATDLLAAGVPDATVAELLGHSGTKILHEHYSHLCARQRHLRESLGKARGG